MKNLPYVLFALILIAFVINGCKKSELPAVPKNKLSTNSLFADSSQMPKLTASQLTTTKYAPDTLTITGLSASDTVHWSITPPGHATILEKSRSRYIVSFDLEGLYTIKAIVNGTDTLSTSLRVDSVSSTPYTTNIPFAEGDQILVIPSLFKSASADSTFITFRAKTTKTYPCINSFINSNWGIDLNNNFSVDFMDIEQPNNNLCMGPGTLAINMPFLQNAQNPYMVNGIYPLAITFKGTTYKGNIKVSPHDIKFDWNYTSGVTFSTKKLGR